MADLPPASSSPPRPIAPAMQRRRRWPIFTSSAFVLVAVGIVAGLAIGAQLRSPSENTPTDRVYTDQQVASAKTNVCTAFDKVTHALDLSSARNGGDDSTAILSVATSVRQVLDVGSRYLLTKLAEEPATPPDLANAIHSIADAYQNAVLGYLDELSNSDPDLQSTVHAADEAARSIQRLCK
jgi:hypothetical protein